MSTLGVTLDRPAVRRLVVAGGALVAAELVLLGAYFTLSSRTVLAPRYVLYPFVWIDVALLALVVVDRPRATGRRRLVALCVAVGYLVLVAWLDGTVAAGTGTGTVRVLALSPGWGPALLYDGVLRLALLPFKVVGYGVLAYLVYGLVADVARSTLVGGTVGLAATSTWSYDLSTLAFVVSVGLLAWRPSIGSLGGFGLDRSRGR